MKESEVSKWKESRRRQNKGREVSKRENNSKEVREEGNSLIINGLQGPYEKALINGIRD